ncbi:hypothetical protein DFQ27_006980 [Actinomortierella ambigua]|uniref:HCP-like protein n=1 Tax=Actinomortierella ambigua TaxID=1343610 RepID=A0A9P6QKK1_9FUNG|nr:hypothetical protein DFQ27_006980 [Actinomortierella ambigua]
MAASVSPTIQNGSLPGEQQQSFYADVPTDDYTQQQQQQQHASPPSSIHNAPPPQSYQHQPHPEVPFQQLSPEELQQMDEQQQQLYLQQQQYQYEQQLMFQQQQQQQLQMQQQYDQEMYQQQTVQSWQQQGQGQPQPVEMEQPVLSHAHLKPGHKATLLSYTQTLELYRQNAKKTNDPELQFEFAAFMIDAGKPLEDAQTRTELFDEAMKLLRKLATNGHAESQHYLAECYASGFAKGKPDFDKGFPLWVQASKHGHPDAAYRTGRCYDEGLGTRKDNARAVQFYRKAASANHPGAMWRLGVITLYGELGVQASPRDGVKWLKRAAQAATPEFPFALYELAQLHERGIENIVFVDPEYSVSLYSQAAELGHAASAFRLGECWEYGKLGCKQDPRLSIHYYTLAAQQEHPEACFALAAWYLVGSPGILPQSDAEAYIWAKRAADKGLAKALYAMGYFTEVGIGPRKDAEQAIEWYKKAAQAGDKRAVQRLEGVPIDDKKDGKRDEKCTIM